MQGWTKQQIAEILKEARNKAGLTQKEAAQSIGRKQQTLASWEVGQSQPDANTLFLLFNVYGLSLDEAFGFKRRESLNANENTLVKKYRALDEHGQEVTNAVLDIEYERCTVVPVADVDEDEEEEDYRIVPFPVLPASAGDGKILDGDDVEQLEIPDIPEYRQVDFALRVSGNSMLPTYRNGDIVLVREQPAVNIGEVGIFVVNGEGFIKEQGKDSLISHNRRYADIVPDECADVRCLGKVLAKLDE